MYRALTKSCKVQYMQPSQYHLSLSACKADIYVHKLKQSNLSGNDKRTAQIIQAGHGPLCSEVCSLLVPSRLKENHFSSGVYNCAYL
jgi:hypothetical protein